MNSNSPEKIARFLPDAVSSEELCCGLCGSPKPESVCRRCAFRLIDLGLSSATEEFPCVVSETPLDRPSRSETFPLRYDHYEVCELSQGKPWELGRGAMGVTYKAIDTNLGSVVALKVINNLHLGAASSQVRFLREAKSAAQLSHSNIARVFHLGQEGENSFYAMEFIEGETLEAYIRREGALPWELALNIVTQCTYALRVAHSRGFIHRDIKPTNIMLVKGEHASERDITAKVIDFGLVKAVNDDATQDSICLGYFAGTPYFASPEQWEAGTVDARSDIFSLGVCLWYMLTAVPPRIAITSVDGWRQSPLPPLPEVELPGQLPEYAKELLRSMIASDPMLRPQTAALLLEKLVVCHTTGYPEDPKKGFWWINKTQSWIYFSGLVLLSALTFLPQFGLRSMGSSKPAPSILEQSAARREARALYNQGEEYRTKLTKADNRRAIGFYTEAISRAPEYSDAFAGLAFAGYQNVVRFGAPVSEMDAAVANAQRAIDLDPKAPKAYHALAAIRSFQGQPWQALAQLHRALELEPKYLPAARDFSLLWCSVGRPELALAWAKTAAEHDPSSLRGLTAVADASVDLCDDESARQCYQRCLKINPAWMAARYGLIHIDILEKNFAQARRDHAVAHSIGAEPIYALTLEAQIALFTGEYAEAEKAYRELLTMDRGGLVRYYGGISYLSALGFLRQEAGDVLESQALLDEAAKLHIANSDGPQAVYDLAAIRSIQGHREDALALLDQAIAAGWIDHRVPCLDPRFRALWDDPQFRKMMDGLKRHVMEMQIDAQRLCSKPLQIADYPVEPPNK